MSGRELRRAVYEELRKRPGGLTRQQLQQRFGIADPALEDERVRVWKLAAALSQLTHEGFAISSVDSGEMVYYPQSDVLYQPAVA
jgi:hypothetical protein